MTPTKDEWRSSRESDSSTRSAGRARKQDPRHERPLGHMPLYQYREDRPAVIIVPTLVRSESGKPEPIVYCASCQSRLTYDVAYVDIDNAPPAMRWYCRACAEQINRDNAFAVAQPQALARSADKS